MKFDSWSLDRLKQLKEIVDCLVSFSQSNIIKTNFLKAFYDHSLKDADGHTLYGNFRLFGAKSFRLTSNNPKLFGLCISNYTSKIS